MVKNITCSEFDDERPDHCDDEYDDRLNIPLINREGEEQSSESIDREPGAALTSSDEVTLIDSVEEHLIYPTDYRAEHNQKNDGDYISLFTCQIFAHGYYDTRISGALV